MFDMVCPTRPLAR